MSDGSDLDDMCFERSLRRLLPIMFCNAAKRIWSSSVGLYRALELCLEVPALRDADNCEKDSRPEKARSGAFSASRRPLPTELVFLLIGDVFRFTAPSSSRATFATIENVPTRVVQSRDLVEILGWANLGTEDFSAPFEITFLLSDIIQSLGETFGGDVMEELVAMASDPLSLTSVDYDRLAQLVGTSSNASFRDLFEQLLLPLLHCQSRLWDSAFASDSNAQTENYALAKVYLGMLRYHLLLPGSPLDPGQEPIAKISLIKRRLSNLGYQLSALQLDSGILSGNFFLETDESEQLLSEGRYLLKKKREQENQVIERPDGAPPFFELYRETREFSQTHISIKTVRRLVEMVREPNLSDDSLLVSAQQEENWQRTSEAFCDRLLTKFADYEDITVSLVGAVGLIKEGMSLLFDLATSSEHEKEANAVALAANFPLNDFISGTDKLIYILLSISVASRESVNCRRALALAVLSRLRLQSMSGLDRKILSLWFVVMDEVVKHTESESDKAFPVSSEGRDGGERVQSPVSGPSTGISASAP